MENRDRIILDGMGGDHAPGAVAEGAALASRLIENTICIVGDEKKLAAELARHKHDAGKIEIVHAEEVISGDEAPVRAVRTKQRSSIVVGLNMVKNGEGGGIRGKTDEAKTRSESSSSRTKGVKPGNETVRVCFPFGTKNLAGVSPI